MFSHLFNLYRNWEFFLILFFGYGMILSYFSEGFVPAIESVLASGLEKSRLYRVEG